MAFQEGEEELQRAIVAIMFEDGYRGAFTGHVAVAGELTAHIGQRKVGLCERRRVLCIPI
jgi:hypothetical protein